MATIYDDSNVNLVYYGNWQMDGQPDVGNDAYFNKGDYLEVQWTGGDIAIYGARHTAQGVYGISVDSSEPQFFSGFANPGTYQQAIYASSGLQQGYHVLRLSNENTKNVAKNPTYLWLDVDFVTVFGSLQGDLTGVPPPAPTPSESSSSSAPSPTSSSPSSTESSAAYTLSTARSQASGAFAATSLSGSSTRTVTSTHGALITAHFGDDGSGTTVTAPNGPNLSAPTSQAAQGDKEASSKTTVVASVAVTAVSGILIFAILGFWVRRWQMRKRVQGSFVKI